MGFLKGGIFTFLGLVLFVLLLFLSSFLTMSFSLEHDSVKSGLVPVIKDLANSVPATLERFDRFDLSEFDVSGVIDENYELMQYHCVNYTEYGFLFEGQMIDMPCSTLEGGKDAVIDKTAEDFVEGIYYKEYNCDYWDCVSQEKIPFFIVSEKSKDYWNGKFYSFLLPSLIIIALMFFFVDNKMNLPIIVGILFVLSSFSFSKISGVLLGLFSPDNSDFISSFFNILFSRSGSVFWIFFILGFILIAGGVAFWIWNWESVKKKFSKRDVRSIVKEEVGKNNMAKRGKKF